ncbi:MAG: hypothetical protein M1484_02655 [Patescibacteria group bacterium]|nr:hypothetical protein [Patescibacteria group bacterium]MCL5431982.1 hypothetical protein [Patescibacteria group bacterium]
MRKILFGLILLVTAALLVSPKIVLAANNDTYVSNVYDSLVVSITNSITGTFDRQGKLEKPGAITFLSQTMGLMSSVKPASGVDFTRYLASHFQIPGTPKPAYAASVGGIGFDSLQPLLVFWTVMRNLAYMFFAIVFVVIGMMIMFRVKIDPKTTANIQTALPKIIMALIVVTFSYAIAGFLIDIMYVLIGLIISLATSLAVNKAGVNLAPEFTGLIANNSIFAFWLNGSGSGPAGGVNAAAAAAVAQAVDSFVKGPLGAAGGSIAGLIGGSIAWLIFAVAILFVLFKTWWALLGAYGSIILNIIVAPLWLMLDAIPGQNQFEAWIRSMLANLLAFPLVIGMIFIAWVLTASDIYQNGFVPPLIGGNTQGAIQAIVGLAILLTIPKTVEIMQQVLKAPQSKFATAWGEAVSWGYQHSGVPLGIGMATGTGKAGAREGLERVRTAGTGTFVERLADVGIAAGQNAKWWTR